MFKPIINNIGSFLKIRTQVWYQLEEKKIIKTIENFFDSDFIIHKDLINEMYVNIDKKKSIYIYDIIYKGITYQYHVELNTKNYNNQQLVEKNKEKKVYPRIIFFTDDEIDGMQKKNINFDIIPISTCYCDIKHYFESELNIVELQIIKKKSYKKLLNVVTGIGDAIERFRINMVPTNVEFYLTYHHTLNDHNETFGFLYIYSSTHHCIGIDVGFIG